MTDAELERRLFALPLEETPADLRARILAVTIDRPKLAFRAWEVWLVGILVALTVWLTFLVCTLAPQTGDSIHSMLGAAIERFTSVGSINILMWMGLGISLVVWIPQLSLPLPRHSLADR